LYATVVGVSIPVTANVTTEQVFVTSLMRALSWFRGATLAVAWMGLLLSL